MRITRHLLETNSPYEYFEEACTQELPYYLQAARGRPQSLSSLESTARLLALSGSVVQPDSPEISRALRIAAQADAGLFAFACLDGGTVTLRLGDGPPVTVTGKVNADLAYAGKWVQAFYLCCLCREKELLASLCQTSTDLLGESSTQAPYYVYTLVDALKEFAAEAPSATDLLQHVFQVMEDEQSRLTKYAYLIDQPAVELLLNIQRDEREAFAKDLPKAVEAHKRFWGSSKELRQDWDGFLSIPLLGISAIAYDRGFRFEVDSEYLPMHLVRGDFLRGEQP